MMWYTILMCSTSKSECGIRYYCVPQVKMYVEYDVVYYTNVLKVYVYDVVYDINVSHK